MSVPQVPPVPGAAPTAAAPARRNVAFFAMAAVILSLFVATPASTQQEVPSPGGCDRIDRRMDLYAEVVDADNLGYGLAPGEATNPGPLIEMVEGECLAITLHNNIPLERLPALDGQTPGVSLHTHGVKYTIESDGTAHSDSVVPPGESRTYIWFAAPREVRGRNVISNGTAGYWWYHDHNIGDEHGSVGIGAGLAGGLVVRRPGDPRPDRTYTTVFHQNNLLNWQSHRQTDPITGRPATDDCDPMNPVGMSHNDPDTGAGPCFVAEEGELIEFVNIAIGEFVHTWHLHGHNWAQTRTGIAPWSRLAADIPLEDNHIMAAGDSFGFMMRAGDKVGPGAWMLHCHVGSHAAAGMWTFLHVLDESGQIDHDHEQQMTPGFENADEGVAPETGDPAPPATTGPGGRADDIRAGRRG